MATNNLAKTAVFDDIAAEVSVGVIGEPEPRLSSVENAANNTDTCSQLTAVFQQVVIYVIPIFGSALPAASFVFFPQRSSRTARG